MNKDYSQLMINNLLEENRRLKKIIKSQTVNKNVLNEKLNLVRSLFSIFENTKSTMFISIVMFGEFLENLISKKQINNSDLYFYFSDKNVTNKDTSTMTRFFNIINNFDYLILLKITSNELYSKYLYSINKNNVKFNIIFYTQFPYNNDINFFNIQNMILDSNSGLQVKYLTDTNRSELISNKTLSFLDTIKSIYLNEATLNTFDIPQRDLYSLIVTQEKFINNGFTIKNGVKLINLYEKCAICYEENLKGLFLDCRHAFCISCIKKHLISNNEEKKCPLCRSILNIVFE